MDRLNNGAILGPYRILHQIGEGGMAKVYKAFQANMERYVALKVLPTHYADEPQFAKRFIQEARTIARLEHKNILPVYDFGEHNGITYLAMRYLEGGNLKDVLSQGRLTLHDTLEVMDQVCSALGYAHRQGVIHRDVKPANIMIDSEGAVYLTDFGIAKVVGKSSDLTATGAAIGTPAYMAPEQAVGEKVDGRTDLYALGVVLYEMVVGRVPFKADTPMAVLLAHLHDPLPLPSQVDPQVHAEIENVIIKTLSKEPDDRYQSADALIQALRQAIYTAAPEALETTLVNLISEIRASRSSDPTLREGKLPDEISDPNLREKLEQLYIDGLSAYWIQDWERAQARLQEVIGFDPNYKDAAVRLAEIKKQSQLDDLHNQAQEAIEHARWGTAQGLLQEILSTAPDDPEAKEKMVQVVKQLELASLYTQCEQLFEAGQWQAVIKIFEHIHQLDRDYPDPQKLQAQAQEALEELQRLDTIKVTYQQGLQALDDGKWKRAQKLFTTINAQQPGYAETEQLLARARDEITSAKSSGGSSRFRFKPWVGLIVLVIMLVFIAGIWYVNGLRSDSKSLESYAMPTSTPDEDASTPPKDTQSPKGPEQDDMDLVAEDVYEDFSAPDGQLDPDRWRVACNAGQFEALGGTIENGQLEFLNTEAPEYQQCSLEVLKGERIPGEALGGIAATLREQHLQGEMNGNTWVSFTSDLKHGHVLRTFCGVQSWPDLHLALFGVNDSRDGEVFYADMPIDPDVPHDVRLQADPDTMAIRCQVDEAILGVWLPEDPDLLRGAEFIRSVDIERHADMVAHSQIDEVRLLSPREKPIAECPEITDWKAEYWNNADLAGAPVLCRDEGFPVHFWVYGSPHPDVPVDWFSARYTKEMAFEGGNYTFRLSGDDGIRLWLDDEILIDEWWDHDFIDYYADVDIPAGPHTLRVEYFEHGGEAHIELLALQGDQLLFNLEPGCVEPPEGLIGWWAGDGDATNELGGPAGELVGGTSFVPGKIGEAFHFDPTSWEQAQSGAVEIPLTPEYKDLQGFSIEAWVYLEPGDVRAYPIEDIIRIGRKFRLGNAKESQREGRLILTVPYATQIDNHLTGEVTFPRGEWVHAVGIYTGEEILLFQNANLIGAMPAQFDLGTAAHSFTLSNPSEPMSGMLDEVSLYNRPLNMGEIRLLYYVGGAHGKCK